MRQRRVAGQTSSNCLFDLISSECDEVKIFNRKTKCRRQGPGNNYHVFFMSLCNVQFGGGTAIENVRHKASGCTMWQYKCIAAIKCFRQDLQMKCFLKIPEDEDKWSARLIESPAGWTQITQVISTEESNVAEEKQLLECKTCLSPVSVTGFICNKTFCLWSARTWFHWSKNIENEIDCNHVRCIVACNEKLDLEVLLSS